MIGETRPMRFRHFYPGDTRAQVTGFIDGFEPPADLPAKLCGAVVPHAGWRFSGGVAARAIQTLAMKSRPDAVIVLGAVHRERLTLSAVHARGRWETPLGDIGVAEALAQELLACLSDLATENEGAHDAEHSIEVELPILHELFPGVPVVPIMVPPGASPVEFGARLARLVNGRNVVTVASTDLTHYGERYGFLPAGEGEAARDWMEENDRRMIDLAVQLAAERVTSEAQERRNACGPGALAAVVAFARETGAAKGVLLEHTTSHDVVSHGEPFTSAVGYAGLIF